MSAPVWLAVVFLLGAGAENPFLPLAREQLSRMEETRALRTLERARAWQGNTPEQLARVHLYLGLAHGQLSHEQEAVRAFRKALLLDPTLMLPAGASPNLWRWWRQAGGTEPAA